MESTDCEKDPRNLLKTLKIFELILYSFELNTVNQ